MDKFKLIIAEDEPPILRNIHQKVEASGTCFEVVGTASDGREAMLLIDSLKPDAALVDINMPFIDGISLIKEVRVKYPNMIFVIISGYQEFDYARQAMKMGVEDYLVKPVTLDTITTVLSAVENQLSVRKATNERELFSSILRNESIDSSKIMTPDMTSYIQVLFCFGPYSSTSINLVFSENVGLSNEAIEDFFMQRLGIDEKCMVVNGRYTNEKVAIINICRSTNEDILNAVDDFIHQSSVLHMPITAVVGRRVHFHEIDTSISETRKKLHKDLVIGKSQVLTEDALSKGISTSLVISVDMEKSITGLFQQGNKRLLKAEFQKLFHLWENQDCTQSTLDKLLKHMLSLLQRQVISKGFNSTINADLQINEILSTSFSFNDILEGFWYIVENLLENQKQSEKDGDSSKQLIDQIETYLCKNIAEPLTLQALASKANLAPQYFCMLFKKYKGISPIEYLISLRISKAKELLKLYSKMPVKDVAEMVGYSDQHYFSKIFKASTGYSPKEYRSI